MKKTLAFALLLPVSLESQEPVQQGAALQKWKDEQVALGAANDASRAKRAEQAEKTIVDLERRQQHMFQAWAQISGSSTVYGYDPDFIKSTGEERRGRIEKDAKSAAHLDSVRRVGQPSEILNVLMLRRESVLTFEKEARSVEFYYKESLQRWTRALERTKDEDYPNNPPNVKAAIKALIDHNERLVRLGRGVVDFEGKRAQALKEEAEALGRQIDMGRALRIDGP